MKSWDTVPSGSRSSYVPCPSCGGAMAKHARRCRACNARGYTWKDEAARDYPLDLTRPCIEHTQRGPRYGRVKHRGRLCAQHVQAWEIANRREVPAGWVVDHLCFNPRCILPAHLEAVPPIVNARRQRNVRLTPDAVATIRAEYGLNPRHLHAIVTGKLWAT